MQILLINAPSRRNSLVPPLGLLQVGAIIERLGCTVLIYDPILDDPMLKDPIPKRLDMIVDDFKPNIIGYGGIATSYAKTKKYARYIRNKNKKIIQIAGGPLSSVYELLLMQAWLDVVVHGEAEVSLPLLLERLEGGKPIDNLPGISILKDGKVIRNPLPEQIKSLDTLPLPAYHLVELPRYFRHMKDNPGVYNDGLSKGRAKELVNIIGEDDRWIEIVTGRGCTHRCLFCYRHMKGVRYYSPDYVVKHITYLKSNYGIRGFQFAEELFNGDINRVYDLCDAIEKNRLDIFYSVGGARVDKMDKAMMKRLKETGCIEINYGQESGSDKILKEYRKGVTVSQNKEITKLTIAEGLNCPVQLVIGSPGETDSTIKETINFLKDVEGFQYSLNYLIPLPETPIWEYVREKELIKDVEEYLYVVSERGGEPVVNLTEMPDRIWKRWRLKIKKEMRIYYFKKTNQKGRLLIEFFIYSIGEFIYPYVPPYIVNIAKRLLKNFISP